jgi:hypothetical protein
MLEMRRDLVKRVPKLPVEGTDQRKMTDVDGLIFLVIDFYVLGGIRMQLRLKSFFVSLMSGSANSKLLAAAVADAANEERNKELQAQAADLIERTSSSIHVTWDEFKAFNSLVELEAETEPKNDGELMAFFSKFHDIMVGTFRLLQCPIS